MQPASPSDGCRGGDAAAAIGSRGTAAKYFAEFFGTYALVLTVGCNALRSSQLQESIGGASWAPMSVACALTVLIYAFGDVSGANLNPAVSLALAACRKLHPKDALLYVLAQLTGGGTAGITCVLLFSAKATVIGPKEGFDWREVAIVEFIYTAVLCFVVLNCAASTRNNPTGDRNRFYGLAIGFVVVAGGYAAGNISGACFNPAVSFGMAIPGVGLGLYKCLLSVLLYLLFQTFGGLLAATLFWVVRPEDFGRIPGQLGEFAIVLAAEFLGTFVLVFTVVLNILGQSPATPISAAAALMSMVYSLGDVSGAHFNPAVTTGVALSGRKKDMSTGAAYMAIQVVAGVLAALLASNVHNWESLVLVPEGVTNLWSIIVAEMLFTFLLVFVVLSVATTKLADSPTGHNNAVGLAIGMCVVVGGFAIGTLSNGSLNPAVSISLSSLELLNKGNFSNGLVYSIFELAAGALAAAMFFITHPEEYPLLGK